LLDPLVEALRRYVMAAGKLHADDTRVPVLAPGTGKTKTASTGCFHIRGSLLATPSSLGRFFVRWD
jgi:Transposase IS66 family